MTENMLQLIASLKLLIVTGYATLYGLGGMNGKWKRRILGSGLYTALLVAMSLWTGSFSPWLLCVFPLLYGATSIGYGGTDVTAMKIFKRGYCGLAYAFAALPVAIVSGNYALFALHTALCITVSILLGVFGIATNARYEETIIGATIVFLPIYMI